MNLNEELQALAQIRKRAKRLKRARRQTDAERITELEAEVRILGSLADVCTYDVLREICDGCRCKRAASGSGESL